MMKPTEKFNLPGRLLHWMMAMLVLAMLLIGIGMVSTVSPRYHLILPIHRSIGTIVIVLVSVRLINRIMNPRTPPPLPSDLPNWQKMLAQWSHWLLYTLMFLLPVIGWSMLSAADEPIVIFGSVHLPSIVPPNARVFALLRLAHTAFAFVLFATFITHLGAALFHALIRRDNVLESML
jgi:cytochrome b561